MKKLFILALVALFAMISVSASPVFRVKKTVRQSDGTTLNVTRTGADHIKYYVTDDNMPVFPNAAGDYCYAEFDDEANVVASQIVAHEADVRTPMEQNLATRYCEDFHTFINMKNLTRYGVGSLADASVKCMGDVKVAVILAAFSDLDFQETSTIEQFDKHFNASNYKDEGGAGSVRDYFISQSDSMFRPTFDVLCKVTLDHTRKYYGGNYGGSDRSAKGYIADAISAAISKGTDFSPYADKDGNVFVIVIYPGHGEQVSGPDESLWAAYYYSLSKTVGNLKFTSGLVMDELADYGAGEIFDGIGTLCHEFSHALGLPDFYNTNSTSGIFGMDAWDIMDYGQFDNQCRTPVGYTAYEREFMGWLKIDTLQDVKQEVVLPPLSKYGPHKAYRIPNKADASGHEYYLLENHQNSDWYLKLYGEGMLIVHVDYNASAWVGNTVNNNASHQRMTIIPADNVLTQHSGKASTYKGDPFPGYTNVTEFSNTTTPAATAYVGGFMNIKLKNIHEDGNDNIVFYYQCDGKLTTPTGLKASDIGETSFNISFNEVSNAEEYMVKLYDGEELVRTDTISSSSSVINNLQTEKTYTVTLTAIAKDYLDSNESKSISVVCLYGPKGDVNRDGNLNAADVVSIYNYILIGENSGTKRIYADVDADGSVNGADVTAFYNIIVGN